MPRLRALVGASLAAALGGVLACGDTSTRPETPPSLPEMEVPSGWSTYRNEAWGYTVDIPPGWHHVSQPRRSDLGDPVVILALATFPLRDDDAQYPIPRQGFDADEGFLTIQERGLEPGGWSSFPPRPGQFRFKPHQGSIFADAVRRATGIPFRDHWFNFTDAGRHFHVQVAIGNAMSDAKANEPYRILDSLRLDPTVRPDWPSAG
jgi:hypothetical protein